MNLQGNGNNHNHKRNLEDENDAFISFKQSSDYERITGQKPVSENPDGSVSIDSDEERKEKLREAIEMENSSAYDDLDDFVYRQNKKRAKSKGGHHHHRHRSPSRLSPQSSHRSSSQKRTHKHRHHFRRHHHRKRMKKWKKILLGVLISLVALLLAAVVVFSILVNKGRTELLDKGYFNIQAPKSVDADIQDNGNVIEYKGHKYKYNDNITSVLCMGIDADRVTQLGEAVGTGGQADTLFLLAMDLSNGKSKIINISRDTMTDISIYAFNTNNFQEKKRAQLALAHSYGAGDEACCQHQLEAVREIFYNVPINTFYALNMNGIGVLNNAVGGVSVTSPETVGPYTAGETYDLWYEEMGSEEDSWRNPVTFVRTRSHDRTDANNLRMQRQKIFLDAFTAKLYEQTKSNMTAPLNIYNTAKPYSCSNLTTSKLSYLTVSAFQKKFNGFEIVNVPGTVKEGKEKIKSADSEEDGTYAEFIIDEEKFFELFLSVYYNQIS